MNGFERGLSPFYRVLENEEPTSPCFTTYSIGFSRLFRSSPSHSFERYATRPRGCSAPAVSSRGEVLVAFEAPRGELDKRAAISAAAVDFDRNALALSLDALKAPHSPKRARSTSAIWLSLLILERFDEGLFTREQRGRSRKGERRDH